MKDFMEQQLWLAPRHFLILLLNSGGQLKNYSDCRFQWSLKVVCCAIRVKGKRFTEVKQEWELNKWCNFCIFKPWTVWAFILTFFGLNRYIRVMFIAVIRDHEPFKKSTPMHNCCRKSAEENSERLCCHSGHYAAGREAPTFCFSHIFCQSVSAGPDQDLAEQTKGSHGLDKYLAFSCVPFASLCFSSPISRFWSRIMVMLIFLGFRPQVFHL